MGKHSVAVIALLLLLHVAGAAPSVAQAQNMPESVTSVVDEVAGLPGYEIRRVYLEQQIDTRGLGADEVARLRGALEVLNALSEAGHVERTRLRALLALGASGDPDKLAMATDAARTGKELPASSTGASEPQSQDSSRDWLDDVETGIGPLTWGTSRYVVLNQLGGKVEWNSINAWDGPRYQLETGYYEFASSVAGCDGDFYLFFNHQGLSRFWFSTSEARCWLVLKEHLEVRRGAPRTQVIEDEVVTATILEWEGRAPIKMAVEGVESTSIFISVEAPEASSASAGDSRDEDYSEADYWEERDAAKSVDRRTRGERLRRRSAGPGVTGLVLLMSSFGTGIASFATASQGEFTASAVLTGVSVGIGVPGGALVTIGVVQDVHGTILIRRGGGIAANDAAGLFLSLGAGTASLTARW